MEAGGSTAGLGRIREPQRTRAPGLPFRLDPFALPVRFEAFDDAADQRLRIVDLHRDRVVLRRSVNGMRMALNLPVAAFRGVAIRLVGDESIAAPSAVAVMLEHGDPALSLFSATQSNDIVAEWQCWGRVLGLPLLIAESDGSLHELLARFGTHLRVEAPIGRRRRRSAIARRRPARILRRRLV